MPVAIASRRSQPYGCKREGWSLGFQATKKFPLNSSWVHSANEPQAGASPDIRVRQFYFPLIVLISKYKGVSQTSPWKSHHQLLDGASYTVMCIYLFYQIRKTRRNRRAREEHTQPTERVQAKQTKQKSLCEHQLADAAKGTDDGVLNGTIPGSEDQQRRVEQRGSTDCLECTAEKKRARIYRWKVLLSLVMANMMGSMDLTIIATALPTIASHFCKPNA